MTAQVIGAGRNRVDGRAKITGATAYTGDLDLPGMTHLRLVLSPHARAEIRAYELEEARNCPGVLAVVSAEDLDWLHVRDGQLPLARHRVNFEGQPVVAVVAESEAAADDGAALVRVDYNPLQSMTDVFEAIKTGAPAVLDADQVSEDDSTSHGAAVAASSTGPGHPNIATEVHLQVGDIDEALARSAQVVSGRYVMPRVHQSPIETHVTVARPEPGGGLTVWTSTQRPFEVRSECANLLGLKLTEVRVVSPPMGGGFGGKAVSMLEPIVAAMAHKLGRPVKCQLTRTEEFLLNAAIGAVIDIEVGADAEGNLLGLRIKAWYDCGVRTAGGSRLGAILLCGTYRLPSYAYDAYDVQTNKAPSLPYRAPSAVGFFALESAVEELATKLGLDPLELRLRNASRSGDPYVSGGTWPVFGLVDCLEAARGHRLLVDPVGPGEGVGIAVGTWGGAAGAAAAACGVESDGTLVLHVGYADATGVDTTYAMIAAQVLGMSADNVVVATGDTSSVPYSGNAGGSRSVLTVGNAVKAAAEGVRRQLERIASDHLEAAPEDLVFEGGQVHVAGSPTRGVSIAQLAAATGFAGSHYGPLHASASMIIPSDSPMATVHLCRVRADVETGEWAITGYAAIQDVGRALNPPEILGQIYGGALQSIGRALGEEMSHGADGALRSANFIDYEIPTIDQAPSLSVILVEVPSATGPFGARGVGEPPAIPGAAAVANALRAATGLRSNVLPLRWSTLAEPAVAASSVASATPR